MSTTAEAAVPQRARREPLAGLAALGAGALVAAGLPPWGWWPLAFVGWAVLDRLIADRSRRTRFARGWLFGLGWLAPGMGWMWFLTAPGYLVASTLYAAYIAAACALVPAGRWRWLALPAAVALAECLRWSFPFEGVPLASLAIGQAASPLATIGRVAGPLAITAAVVAIGQVLSALSTRAVRPAAAAAAAVAVLLALAAIAPTGQAIGSIDVAAVQGGGPQGTRAVDTDPREVIDRHLDAATEITGPVDLIVFPENVVNMSGQATFVGSGIDAEFAAVSRAHGGAPVLVGVNEVAPSDPERVINAQVALGPDGDELGRYVKVRRVPFGEYMPFRRLLTALGAPTDLVPTDAVAGTGPAVIDVGERRIGVVISWEVFFAGRAREAARYGGEVLVNPTNGSSYTGTVLQTQQIASSRLRAIETGRWVVQAAPTGFSAVITPAGAVVERSGISEQRVIERTVGLRKGRTWYVALGERPIVAVLLALVAAAVVADRRRLTDR